MLNSSRKAKGKRLEDFVVKALKEIDPTCYRRADSGSGRDNKEDVTTVLPLHIECKNQEVKNVNKWWKQTCDSCPEDKFPILVYKKNFQREPIVLMCFDDLCALQTNIKRKNYVYRIEQFLIQLKFSDFIKILKDKSY